MPLFLLVLLLLAGCATTSPPAPEGVAPGTLPGAPQVMVMLEPAPPAMWAHGPAGRVGPADRDLRGAGASAAREDVERSLRQPPAQRRGAPPRAGPPLGH